jgi:molybdopterin synthase catalytic subunit
MTPVEFRLTELPIDPAVLLAGLGDTRAGAFATFEGRVRNRNDGRVVERLDYEAFAPLAEKEGGRIVREAREKFHVIGALCVHRTGSLALGDISVWVAVTAEHRAAALDACRYIIDEIKARLPVWKKEHYAGGASEWINCAAPAPSQGIK